DAPRPAGSRDLLVKVLLAHERQRAAAPGFGPADAGPAAVGELALPVLAQLGVCLVVAGAAPVLQRREAPAQVLGHPLRHLGAEGLVVGGEGKLHGKNQSSSARAMRSRHCVALPSQWPAACARLKYRCGSYSQVKPTPPCSWMASCAQKKKASLACAL